MILVPKPRRPAYYKAPLKSWGAIIAFLAAHQSYYRTMSTCSPLAWNVKDYGSDLSFEHLVAVYRESVIFSPLIFCDCEVT